MPDAPPTADTVHADIGIVHATAMELSPLLARCDKVRKYIGPGLDIAHSVAGGKKLLHLGRNVEVEILDPKLMDTRTQHAPLRVMASAASLASFLPVQAHQSPVLA